jgi:hypothetical protein
VSTLPVNTELKKFTGIYPYRGRRGRNRLLESNETLLFSVFLMDEINDHPQGYAIVPPYEFSCKTPSKILMVVLTQESDRVMIRIHKSIRRV